MSRLFRFSLSRPLRVPSTTAGERCPLLLPGGLLRTLLAVALTACATTSDGGGQDAGGAASSGSSSGAGSSGAPGGPPSGSTAGGQDGGSGVDAGGGALVDGAQGGGGADGSSSTGGGSDASGSMQDGAPSGGACPAGATFCTGFEEVGLPGGSAYQPSYQAAQWATFMALDTNTVHSGKQALKVLPSTNSGYDYRMLAVPVPGPSFWVRLYLRSDFDLGQTDHNAFFLASTGTGDPNMGSSMQFAEQYCQVVLNLSDTVVLSASSDGTFACAHAGAIIPKNAWHCVEAHFDGTAGDVSVSSDGTAVIDKKAWANGKLTYASFSFGFAQYHGPARTMWFDDLVVAPARIGCP